MEDKMKKLAIMFVVLAAMAFLANCTKKGTCVVAATDSTAAETTLTVVEDSCTGTWTAD
jgi:hypothetical protein